MVEFTTADRIAGHLKMAGGADTLAQDAAKAVNSMLAGRDDLTHIDPADGITVVATPAAQLGATMLGARLHRRRNTPNGIEALDGSVASYVARTDPDVARLLRLDQYAAPAVG